VVILGSGSLAADIARRLAPLCREQLFIVSRHHERAHDLAVSVGGSWACYADLPQVLKASDVVVACTTAQRPVLHLTNLPCDEQARTVIDLGMPRNVAGDASARANVRLLTLGDFIDRPPLSALDQARLTQVLEHGQRRFERWFEVHRALRAAQMSEAAA
jgi:glutamyl-tRNA reductase